MQWPSPIVNELALSPVDRNLEMPFKEEVEALLESKVAIAIAQVYGEQ